MEATKIIAEHVAKAIIEDMPEDVIEGAKRSMLDNIGVIVASTADPAFKMLVDFVREMGGNPLSRVIGAGFKTSPCNAALVHATLAQVLDYDDSSLYPSALHSAGSIANGVVLAQGEAEKISGAKALEAYIIGYEATTELMGPLMMDEGSLAAGWHQAGIGGALGATIASAKILDLSAEQISRALGIAVSLASGVRANFGTLTKALHQGNACFNGIMAAKLAKAGFTGAEDILEKKWGFYEVFRKTPMIPNVIEDMLRSFGNPYKLSTNHIGGLWVKLHCCCHGLHPKIDLAIELAGEVDTDEIDLLEVETQARSLGAYQNRYYMDDGKPVQPRHRGPRRQMNPSDPKSELEAKFSVECAVARALLEGRKKKILTFEDFKDEKINEPKVRELMKKITVYQTEEMEKLREEDVKVHDGRIPAKLIAILKDGRRWERSKNIPIGTPFTMVEGALERKFRDCFRYASFPEERIEHCIKLVHNLEKLDDITELMDAIEPLKSSQFGSYSEVKI